MRIGLNAPDLSALVALWVYAVATATAALLVVVILLRRSSY